MTAPFSRRLHANRARGFTLIETMVAVAIAGVLSSIAYPSFEGPVLRARRSDALVSLLQAQLAEERLRADRSRYGTLAEIGMRATSAAGHYTLAADGDGDGFTIVATATGRQARDTGCQVLRLRVAGAGVEYASGSDPTVGNAADVNRRCWNR